MFLCSFCSLVPYITLARGAVFVNMVLILTIVMYISQSRVRRRAKYTLFSISIILLVIVVVFFWENNYNRISLMIVLDLAHALIYLNIQLKSQRIIIHLAQDLDHLKRFTSLNSLMKTIYAAHNDFLEIFATYGVFGIVFITLLFALYILRIINLILRVKTICYFSYFLR